jgi:hypothetical protein
MKSGNDNLVVRQHDRVACRLSATLQVAAEHRGKVVVARTAGEGSGQVRVTVVDVSPGGLALESPVYFPKGCRLEVQVDGLGGPVGGVKVRVQRTAMLDRTPRYYLGGAFCVEGAEDERLASRLLEAARRSGTAGEAAGAEKGARDA